MFGIAYSKRILVVGLLLTVSLIASGCASLKKQYDEKSAIVQGCVAGALGGSLIAHVRKRSTKTKIFAGVAGCALGGLAAKEFDDRRKDHELSLIHISEPTRRYAIS